MDIYSIYKPAWPYIARFLRKQTLIQINIGLNIYDIPQNMVFERGNMKNEYERPNR